MSDERPGVRGLGAAHDERRRHIIEAVFAIVDTAGTDQVTIRNVAAEAGVSVGRVQHYFPTKDALLSEAFAAINDRGTVRVDAQQDEDPAAMLTALVDALIPGNEEELRLFRIAQAFEVYALRRPHLRDRLARGYDDLAGLIALLLRRLAPQDPPDTFLPQARELLALATGLAGLIATGAITPEQARQISSRRLADTLSGIPPHTPTIDH